jgi:5-methylcytosine-specific restriction protein A
MFKTIKERLQGKIPDGKSRSPKWRKVRKDHLAIFPYCSICGGEEKVEVHHIQSFATHPELELDPHNLITLCESKHLGINCHLFVGHLGNFENINPNVIEDARYLANRLNPLID